MHRFAVPAVALALATAFAVPALAQTVPQSGGATSGQSTMAPPATRAITAADRTGLQQIDTLAQQLPAASGDLDKQREIDDRIMQTWAKIAPGVTSIDTVSHTQGVYGTPAEFTDLESAISILDAVVLDQNGHGLQWAIAGVRARVAELLATPNPTGG